MTRGEIARQRLHRQALVVPSFSDPVDVVRAFGAVQAQDYPSAKWAIGLRAAGLVDADVERAFSAGAIIRTHVLRPTWHFVTPADIRWMLALTAPRVSSAMGYYNRTLGLDAKVFRKSNTALTRALRDNKQLTRAELSAVLAAARVSAPTGQHVGHLLMQAELDGVICSGARRGKQFTYALLDERVPPTRVYDRDESLAELTRRYFVTRGPATLQDYSWWSGLTIADAKRGVEAVGSFMTREVLEGRAYWFAPSTRETNRKTRTAHLLPNYDEYFIGFKDRSAIGERLKRAAVGPTGDVLMTHIVFVDGQIVGGWKRTLSDHADVELKLLVPLTSAETRLVDTAMARFGEFHQLPVRVRGKAGTELEPFVRHRVDGAARRSSGRTHFESARHHRRTGR